MNAIPEARSARIDGMDLLRGFAVVFVTLSHAIVFTAGSGLAVPMVAVIADEILAPVRMPLMVFLSGLLVAPSLAKGTRRYFSGKAQRVLYPYAVWSLMVLMVLALVPALGSESFEWFDLLRVFVSPLVHLWFLYDLFLFYVIAWATKRISALWVAAFALIVAGISQDYSIGRFFFLLAFFSLGVWGSHHPGRWKRIVRSRVAIVVAIVVVLIVAVAIAVLGPDLRYSVPAAPFAAAGILLATAASEPLAASRFAAPARFIGRNSLVFYLTHWYATLAVVMLMTATGIGWLAIVAGVAGGVAAGAAVTALVKVAPPVNWLFTMPSRSRAASGLSRGRDMIP